MTCKLKDFRVDISMCIGCEAKLRVLTVSMAGLHGQGGGVGRVLGGEQQSPELAPAGHFSRVQLGDVEPGLHKPLTPSARYPTMQSGSWQHVAAPNLIPLPPVSKD